MLIIADHAKVFGLLLQNASLQSPPGCHFMERKFFVSFEMGLSKLKLAREKAVFSPKEHKTKEQKNCKSLAV